MALTVEERKEICTLTATKWWRDDVIVGFVAFTVVQVAILWWIEKQFPRTSSLIATGLLSFIFIFRRLEARRWAKILVREFPDQF